MPVQAHVPARYAPFGEAIYALACIAPALPPESARNAFPVYIGVGGDMESHTGPLRSRACTGHMGRPATLHTHVRERAERAPPCSHCRATWTAPRRRTTDDTRHTMWAHVTGRPRSRTRPCRAGHLAIISCTIEGHNFVSFSLAIEEDSRFRAGLRNYPLADILPTRQKAVGRSSCSARPCRAAVGRW